MADYERFIAAVNSVKRVFLIDFLKQDLEQLEALYNLYAGVMFLLTCQRALVSP